MTKKFLRAYIETGADERALEEVMGEPIRFVASTEGVKRDGLDLKMDRWDLTNYNRNPVFLWVHDYFGRTLPLGRVQAEIEKDALIANVVFDQADEFARQVERKYRTGFLHSVSVGWETVERDGQTFYDLLDISGVPVPGDPDALIERQSVAMRNLVGELRGILDAIPFSEEELQEAEIVDLTDDDDPVLVCDNCGAEEFRLRAGLCDGCYEASFGRSSSADETVWRGISTAMVGIFDPAVSMDDEERKSVYILLERLYRKLEKTPPEFLELAELQAMGADNVRGLFLEDEGVELQRVDEIENDEDEVGSFEETMDEIGEALIPMLKGIRDRLPEK